MLYLPDQELGAKGAEAVALLALVTGQDVEPAEGSDGTDGRWRIARQVAPDRVISTVDPQARHAHKTRSRRQDGDKAHVVVEPDTGIITDTALTPAAGADNSDAAVGMDLLADTATEGERFEVLADSAYGTGDALAALNDAGHTAIIKPWPVRPAVEGGFTLDEFTVTEPDGDHPGWCLGDHLNSNSPPALTGRTVRSILVCDRQGELIVALQCRLTRCTDGLEGPCPSPTPAQGRISGASLEGRTAGERAEVPRGRP